VKVWVDADACPGQIRDIIVRAVHRKAIATLFVANKPLTLPESPHLSSILVAQGPDVADTYIAEHASAGDLVVTQDIPLAAQLVPKKVVVISPRGELYNEDNIHDCLARRDLLQSLRDVGTISGGPRPFDDKLKREFSNHFDAALQRLSR
jgi:uncharacterized protein YaiI (UPF0178 family)